MRALTLFGVPLVDGDIQFGIVEYVLSHGAVYLVAVSVLGYRKCMPNLTGFLQF